MVVGADVVVSHVVGADVVVAHVVGAEVVANVVVGTGRAGPAVGGLVVAKVVVVVEGVYTASFYSPFCEERLKRPCELTRATEISLYADSALPLDPATLYHFLAIICHFNTV